MTVVLVKPLTVKGSVVGRGDLTTLTRQVQEKRVSCGDILE